MSLLKYPIKCRKGSYSNRLRRTVLLRVRAVSRDRSWAPNQKPTQRPVLRLKVRFTLRVTNYALKHEDV
jgi:hypothetical protein